MAPPIAGARSALKPQDRTLGGEVRNDSLRPIEIRARDVRLLNADGGRVRASVVFALAPGHGLYDPARITEQPLSEELRLGLRTRLKPGQTTPLVVAWQERPGVKPPVRIDYGPGSLAIESQ